MRKRQDYLLKANVARRADELCRGLGRTGVHGRSALLELHFKRQSRNSPFPLPLCYKVLLSTTGDEELALYVVLGLNT